MTATLTRRERRTQPSGPPRWVELVPTALLVAAMIVKAIVSPNAARDAFTNTRPLLLTIAVAIVWLLLWLVVLPRFVRNGWIRTGILLVIALGLSAALIVPSVRDKKVVETFPGGAAPRTVVTEPAAGATDSTPTTAPAPAEPVRLATGELAGIDHDATGTVVLYEQPDGTFVVGLENIDVEPGPDYLVYVVPGSGHSEPGDSGVELDALKGNQGTQFYPVPAGTDLSTGEWTVLIWCRAFAVPVAGSSPV